MQTQTEELVHRLQACTHEVMKAEPQKYNSEIKVLSRYFDEHPEPIQLVYTSVVIIEPPPFEKGSLLSGLFENVGNRIQLHLAFTLDCQKCQETHRVSLKVVEASFTDAEEVFTLAEKLHKILNIL